MAKTLRSDCCRPQIGDSNREVIPQEWKVRTYRPKSLAIIQVVEFETGFANKKFASFSIRQNVVGVKTRPENLTNLLAQLDHSRPISLDKSLVEM